MSSSEEILCCCEDYWPPYDLDDVSQRSPLYKDGNSRTAWTLKILMPFLCCLPLAGKVHMDHFIHCCLLLFFLFFIFYYFFSFFFFFSKQCWWLWERTQDMLNFGLGCSSPIRQYFLSKNSILWYKKDSIWSWDTPIMRWMCSYLL